jgi:hypothetical protein
VKTASQDRNLTERELIELLKQAANRAPARAGSRLGLADLLEAGRELGIAREVLEQVFDEHVARRAEQTLRPHDTKIELDTSDGKLRMNVPPAGLRGAHVVQLGFSIFWLTFIAIWTTLAFRGSWLFAAFSIPFWLVGIALARSGFRGVFGRIWLELGRDTGRLIFLPLGPNIELRPELLRVRAGTRDNTWMHRNQNLPPAVILEHGTRTFALLEGWSEAERRWVQAEIEGWLASARGEGPRAA